MFMNDCPIHTRIVPFWVIFCDISDYCRGDVRVLVLDCLVCVINPMTTWMEMFYLSYLYKGDEDDVPALEPRVDCLLVGVKKELDAHGAPGGDDGAG